MSEVNIRMTVRQVTASTSIIDVEGDVSAFAEPVLMQAYMQAYMQANTPSTRTFILNCSGLEYMNSSGIGLLVTLLIRITRQRQHLLAHAGRTYR